MTSEVLVPWIHPQVRTEFVAVGIVVGRAQVDEVKGERLVASETQAPNIVAAASQGHPGSRTSFYLFDVLLVT